MIKSPLEADRHVGSRVLMRRMMLGMSQKKLGEHLNLTFQQVQKYEKGANRIGASRLVQIASALNVPVSFFFEGLATNGTKPGDEGHDDVARLRQFTTDRDGLTIVHAWPLIQPAMRSAFARLAVAAALAANGGGRL